MTESDVAEAPRESTPDAEEVRAERRPRRRPSPEGVITWGLLGASVVFILLQLQPGLIAANTTAAGGDMGAHVWGPDYMRHHLLVHGRVTGWAPSWYDGFPAYTFYFPLPSFVIVVLSFVMPYVIAFKVVSVVGLLTLPLAAYAFGRLADLRFPSPVVLGLATVPFLFDRGFTIYGGNIASTLAGEFSFSIALSFALVFLGVVARGLRTGRHRALAGALLAVTGLSHILPTIFALLGAGVILLLHRGTRRLWYVAGAVATGGMLAAFWALPAIVRGTDYANNMGFGKEVKYLDNLFPPNLTWLLALAGVGVMASFYRRLRPGIALAIVGATYAGLFRWLPEGQRLWNARFLPFWYLCLYLLAGLALAETGMALARVEWTSVGRRWRRNPGVADHGVPSEVSIAAVITWLVIGLPVAVAAIPLVIDRAFTVFGGHPSSGLGGHFGYAISLVLALCFLVALFRGLRNRRRPAAAAVWLAAAGAFHLMPVIAALLVAPVFFFGRLRGSKAPKGTPDGEPGAGSLRPQIGYLLVAVSGGLAVVSATYLPVLLGRADGSKAAATFARAGLVPSDLYWLAALAAAGAIFAILHNRPVGMAIVGVGAVVAVGARLSAVDSLVGARLLPYWCAALAALAALAVWEAGLAVGYLIPGRTSPVRVGAMAVPITMGLATWMLVGLSLGVLPAPLEAALNTGTKQATNDDPAWAKWNYEGYERKSAYPEYRSLMATMSSVGRTYGCGRAHWEYEENINRFGTPLALMLLPYWTHGCIDSMEGLYFESSATTPYHFMTAAELSKAPSDPQRGLPYPTLDVAAGVRHLQLLGTRYYMAFSPEALAQARANADLTEVATSDRWHVFQVAKSDLVTPLTATPAVVTGVTKGERPWLDLAVNWYRDPTRLNAPLAAAGPKSWPRVALHGRSPAPTKSNGVSQPSPIGTGFQVDPVPDLPVVPATVSHIRVGDDRISFDVDRPGSPVLVKASYFPNWQAAGADGPWRVTPNLMVVVPRSRHVSLHYGWTPVDLEGWALTLAGLVLLVVFARRPPVAVWKQWSRRSSASDPEHPEATPTADSPTEATPGEPSEAEAGDEKPAEVPTSG